MESPSPAEWPELAEAASLGTSTFKLIGGPNAAPRPTVDPALFQLGDQLRQLELSDIGLVTLGTTLSRHDDAEDGDDSVVDASGADAVPPSGEVGSLSSLASLRDLTLASNALGPRLPPGAFFGLAHLRSLDLSRNGLASLPASLAACPALTVLALDHNELEALPALLGALTSLVTLRAAGNRLTCAGLPAALFGLPRLAACGLRGNRLAGALPPGFARLGALADLDVADNRLTEMEAAFASPEACKRLKTIAVKGNPWSDKKLAKLAQEEGAPTAKKVFDVLRNGVSKRRAKLVLRAAPQDRPPRMYQSPADAIAEEQRRANAEGGGGGGRTNEGGGGGGDGTHAGRCGKGGRGGGQRGKGRGATAVAEGPDVKRRSLRQVRVRRDALSVRPHLLVCVLHVIAEPGCGLDADSTHTDNASDDDSWWDGDDGGDVTGTPLGLSGFGNDDSDSDDTEDSKSSTCDSGSDNAPPPFVFAQGVRVDAAAFEAYVGINELQTLGVIGAEYTETTTAATSGVAAGDPARMAAAAAVGRMAAFITAQTCLHGNRKEAALGSHNASAVSFPLHYAAEPHDAVTFRPLSVGWQAEKGACTAREFARAQLRDSGLGRAARALLALPLCPVLRDAAGRVLSVAPLSNGYPTRTTADARGALVLECSSATGEPPCRRMLLALISHAIAMVESGTPDAPSKLRLLVEPVQIVADWDTTLEFARFPSREELLALAALPTSTD